MENLKLLNEKRDQLVQELNQLKGSFHQNLTQKECLVNQKLKGLVGEVKSDPKINLLSSLFQMKKLLKLTKLYKFLKKMPKGVINHVHLPAAYRLSKFMEVTYDDRVFLNEEKNMLKVFLCKENKVDNYTRLNYLRKKLGNKFIDGIVRNLVTLTEEEFLLKNDRVIFCEFGKKFDVLMISFYIPFLKMLLPDMV